MSPHISILKPWFQVVLDLSVLSVDLCSLRAIDTSLVKEYQREQSVVTKIKTSRTNVDISNEPEQAPNQLQTERSTLVRLPRVSRRQTCS